MNSASDIPQLPLGLQLRDDARFDNYLALENQPALLAVRSMLEERPLDQFIYLWGPSGAGASHLLQACCHHGEERGKHCFYLPLSEVIDFQPAVLESLEHVDVLCVDDVELMAGNKAWEQAFFHLFNRLRDQGIGLVIAAKQGPADIPIALPDLLSRLRSGLCFHLQLLSDEGKREALIQRAKIRGLQLNEEAADYILSRHSRDTASLLTSLNRLDEASLQAQRKLTIPFIKSVFNW